MRLRLMGGIVMAVGLMVVTGWIADIPLLTTFAPGGSPMVMNTALGVLLCGGALLALAQGWRRAAGLGGAMVAAGCAGVLLQFILDRPLGLDELFWKHQHFAPLTAPGRMMAGAAFALLFVGWSLMLEARGRPNSWLQPVMGGMVLSFALLPVLNYGVGWMIFSGAHGIYRGLPLPTMVGLLLLATALVRPTRFTIRGEGAALSFMAAALGMLIAIGVMVVQSSADLAQANRGVTLTYEVRGSIDHFLSEVARMESAARAYALTGTGSFADRQRYHQSEVSKQLDELRSVLADNPGQLERVERLRTLAKQKFTQSETLMRARQEGGVEVAARFLAGQPTNLTSALVNLADEMQAEETRLLTERINDRTMVELNTRLVRLLGSGLALVLMSVAFNTSRRSTLARRDAEEALRVAHRLQRAVLDGTVFSVIATETNGIIREFNAGAERMLGYTREEMVGKLTPEVIHVSAEVAARAAELSVQLGRKIAPGFEAIVARPQLGEVDEGEWTYVRKDGSHFPVLLSVTALRETNGEIKGYLGIAQDLTERRKFERQLKGSEERTRLFAEHVPAAVAMLDREMRYLVHSARWLEDYGLVGRSILGRSHYEVFPEIPENWRAIHQRCLAGATETNEADRFDRSDGSSHWLSWRVQPWYDGAGEIGGIVMFTQDITQRKRLEESLALTRDQALETSRLKSAFLASVSHEIRTPMNGIIGMTDLLMDTPLNDAQQEMGRVIQNSADNLLTIINDILDFSKVEAGKLDIAAVEFELHPLVDEVLALLAPQAQFKELKLHCEFEARLTPVLLGDAGRIRQVLLNLFGNALKFTERGEIHIAVRWQSEQGERLGFRVEVTDTGIGIPAAIQKVLFQPFTQADGSTTRRFGGTGLGLAISRQLIELMGGTIGLRSEEGRGSTFWFSLELPKAKRESPVFPSPVAEARPVKLPWKKEFHLLVAEDNPTNQLVVQGLVERMGGQTDFASNGAEALQLLARKHYDAVLMDCQMPVMDGYTAARQIRAGAVPGLNPRIPVIALTAYAMPRDRQKCLEAGMDDYVTKPVRAEQLQQAIERCGLAVAPGTSVTSAPAVSDDVLQAAQIEMLRELPGRKHPTLLQELIELFFEETPATLVTLRGMSDRREQSATAKLAHRLAGSSADLGGGRMRQAALAVEVAAGLDEWAVMPDKLAALDREWRRMQDALQKLPIQPCKG